MSRSGYSDDCNGAELNLWRGAVKSAIKGKRGQAFLLETLAALDTMPEKRLITNSLHEAASGEFCTLGVVIAARGIDPAPLQDTGRYDIANALGISPALAAEIMFENDYEEGWGSGPNTKQRWIRMRYWVKSHIFASEKSLNVNEVKS